MKQPENKPKSQKQMEKEAAEARKAKALRDNLRRRKVAVKARTPKPE